MCNRKQGWGRERDRETETEKKDMGERRPSASHAENTADTLTMDF
jgi:hypothetical protein